MAPHLPPDFALDQSLSSRLQSLSPPSMALTLGETGARIRVAESAGRVAVEVGLGFHGAWLDWGR